MHLFNNQKIQFAEWEMRHMLAKVGDPRTVATGAHGLPNKPSTRAWVATEIPLHTRTHDGFLTPHPNSLSWACCAAPNPCTQESVEFIDAQMTLELHTDPYEDLIRAFKSRPIPLAHCLYQCVGVHMGWIFLMLARATTTGM